MDEFETWRDEFAAQGIVKLCGAIEPRQAHRARDLVLAAAREHRVWSDGRWMRSESRFGYPKLLRGALGALVRDDRFPDLIHAKLLELAEHLVGQPVAVMPPGQQILFSLPGDEPWSVPRDAWHIDLPKLGEEASPGLQLFTFLEDVEPGGGATLVVAGSHRLANRSGVLSSKQLKQHLRKHDFFRSLFDESADIRGALMETPAMLGDIELRVLELTGEAGDLYLMDLRMLHTPAINASATARMMLTARLPRATIAARYGAMDAAA